MRLNVFTTYVQKLREIKISEDKEITDKRSLILQSTSEDHCALFNKANVMNKLRGHELTYSGMIVPS